MFIIYSYFKSSIKITKEVDMIILSALVMLGLAVYMTATLIFPDKF